MPQSFVTVRKEGAITCIGMNDPERRNALSAQMRDGLLAAFQDASDDDACRAIVLHGTNEAFCAGGDLRSMSDLTPLKARRRLEMGHRLVRLIAAGPKPVVSAVEAAAFGAGMSLALAADTCVAARSARFGAAFGKVGLVPDYGWMSSVSARIGPVRARRMAMLSETIGAEAAERLALIDRLCEDRGSVEAALEEAERFAAAAPLAIARLRAEFARMSPLEDVLAFEVDAQASLLLSDDHRAAREAFFEKSTVAFRGA